MCNFSSRLLVYLDLLAIMDGPPKGYAGSIAQTITVADVALAPSGCSGSSPHFSILSPATCQRNPVSSAYIIWAWSEADVLVSRDAPTRQTNKSHKPLCPFCVTSPCPWEQDPKNAHANVTKQPEQAADRFMVGRGRNRESSSA